jgi:hypothetical protein
MWDRLEEMLRAFEQYERVAVKAGRKVSKTTFDAIIALWWTLRWPDGKVVITSSGNQNINMALWPELRKLATTHTVEREDGTRETFPKIQYPRVSKLPSVGIKWDDERLIVGYSTDDPERFQGTSGEHLLNIIDEASGVDDMIFHAIFGNVAGGGKIVMTSNPTRPSGYFFDTFQRGSSNWKLLTIASTESPNVIHGRRVIRGLATREWIEETADVWGGTPYYDVHVNGDFPPQADDCVIPLFIIHAARDRYRALCTDEHGRRMPFVYSDNDGPLMLGVDPARFGDDETVITARRGHKLVEQLVLSSMDGEEVASRTMSVVHQHRSGSIDSTVPIRVDEIGVGTSVVDHLKGMPTVRVIPINVANVADDEGRYANKRAELWHRLRKWLENGGIIPDDERLMAELAAPRYDYSDPKGRMRVEEKAAYKKRLKRSPDRADALALAVIEGPGGPLVMPFSAGHHARSDGLTARWVGMPGRGFG